MTDSAGDSRRTMRITFITLGVYALAEFSREVLLEYGPFDAWRDRFPDWIRWLENPVLWFVICVGALMLTHRTGVRGAIIELGLRKPIGPALIFAIIATAPMWLVPLVLPAYSFTFDGKRELYNALIWPLGEEILYRGYLFRQLYRRAGWSFWSSAGLSSLIFGAVHITNAVVRSQPVPEQIATVAMLTVLTIFAAWIMIRWDDNLWVMTAGHGLMNLWWSTFNLADSPLGDGAANAMRLTTIALAVLLTLYRDRFLRAIKRARIRKRPNGLGSS